MSPARFGWGLLLAAGLAAAPLEVPFFRQQKNGCGAASVAMVAHYWAARSQRPSPVPPPPRIYERLYDPQRRGIPLADMKRYLDDLGFQAFTLRGEWRDLDAHLAKGRPIIVGLRKGRSRQLHFVVLTGAEESRVWLNDPTRKRPHRMSRSDFEKRWALADRWMLLATP